MICPFFSHCCFAKKKHPFDWQCLTYHVTLNSCAASHKLSDTGNGLQRLDLEPIQHYGTNLEEISMLHLALLFIHRSAVGSLKWPMFAQGQIEELVPGSPFTLVISEPPLLQPFHNWILMAPAENIFNLGPVVGCQLCLGQMIRSIAWPIWGQIASPQSSFKPQLHRVSWQSFLDQVPSIRRDSLIPI